MKLSEARKGVVAFLSMLAIVLSLALAQGDVIPEGGLKWTVLALAVANAFGVYRVPNDRAPSTTAHLNVRG